MKINWFGGTITRKLLNAFFIISLATYFVTALVVESAVRSAETESELSTLSQLAHLKLDNLNARFDQLATNLKAWSKLDVMNDLISGDLDQRVQSTLVNLQRDYAINGEIYAFDSSGSLIAASDRLMSYIKTLPEIWRQSEEIRFVNKHPSPVDGENIVALVAPLMATFSPNYRVGTVVLAIHWAEISASLSDDTILLYHEHSGGSSEFTQSTHEPDKTKSGLLSHKDTISLMESRLGITPSKDFQFDSLAQDVDGWVKIGDKSYLVNSALESAGFLAGWEVVMLRDPAGLYHAVNMVILKLVMLGLILTLPLFFAIRWLAGRLTAPLIKLTQFVSDITLTQDLSKRLELHSNDEIGVLSADFNRMTERLEDGAKAHLEAEMRLRATIDNALDAVIQMNSDGVITGWNDQAVNIFGWPRKDAIGRLLHDMIIPPQYREKHVRGMQRYLASGEEHILNSRVEMEALHFDGHEFPVELAVTSIEVEGHKEFSAFIRDISSKKEAEEIIWKQANFDAVTGLPNRHMLYDRLNQEIKKAHRNGLRLAVLLIDLDRFKEVNDTLGHDVGDILLVEAASRIRNCVRKSDTVARLGGDEFTVILLEAHRGGNFERVANCILKALAEPFQLGDEIAYISGSIGITMYPDDSVGVDNLLKNADQAMYVSKNRGRNQFSYYTASLQDAAQERRHLIQDLREALAKNQFILYFQPILDMQTGKICKAEALIRWLHPERGLVNPASFIQLAEETGLINKIGNWVFRESVDYAKRWRDQFSSDFQISVNVSPVQFLSGEFSSDVWDEYLQDKNFDGRNIVIEITESLLLNAASGITDRLLKFRDAGIQVAIDDFGTGYSSLSYLKKFDIDYLKIDKSFVDNLEIDQNDMILCEAIIVMAHKLGLKVIAEGVEAEAQQKILSDAGCDYVQGYLHSKPVPAQEFETLLKAVG